MPAVVGAALMAWAGLAWWTPGTVPWVLAELPAAAIVAGMLLRDPIRAALDRSAVDRSPTWPLPATPAPAPVEHAEPLAVVIDLDTHRQQRRRAA